MIDTVGGNETIHVISLKKHSKEGLSVQLGRDKWWGEKKANTPNNLISLFQHRT